MATMSDDIRLQVSREDDDIAIEALWKGIRVGYAWCVIKDGRRLMISDLNVEDRVQVPHPFAHSLLVSIGVHRRTRNFRKQGVGHMLIQKVLSEARAAGITEVWGSVTQDDIDRTRHLLD